jgi:hypothetical protein
VKQYLKHFTSSEKTRKMLWCVPKYSSYTLYIKFTWDWIYNWV